MATESRDNHPFGNGLLLFKAALEQSPNIISLIQSIARPKAKKQEVHDKAQTVQQEIQLFQHKQRPSSGHKYGTYERFRSRPTSAPGPGQYINRRVSLGNAPKMTGRHDSFIESTPGPQTYLLPEPKDTTCGVMPRESKYKDNPEFYQTFLGPGSYDAGGIGTEVGGKFAKEGREAELDVSITQPFTGIRKKPEIRPGPGHYSTQSSIIGGGFSIPKSQPTHRRLSTTLGPGAYSVSLPNDSLEFKFAEAPRFSSTMKDRMKGKSYLRLLSKVQAQISNRETRRKTAIRAKHGLVQMDKRSPKAEY